MATLLVVTPQITRIVTDIRQGAGGGGGGVAAYTHAQPTAATTWTINHNLGTRPVVELRTTGGQVLFSNVTHVSANQVVVTHAYPIAGTAYLTL